MQSVAALQHSLSVTLYQHDAICCCIAELTLSHVVPARCNLLLHCNTHSQSRCTSTMQSVAALQHSLSVTLYQHDAICCSIAALTLSHVVPARCNLLLHCSTDSQSRCTSTMQSVAALQHSLSVTLYQHDAICCCIAALTLSHVVPARCNLLLHCSTHSQSRCTSTMQSVVALQHSLSVTLYQHDAICCSIAALTLSHVVPARCNLLLHCSTHSQSRCTSTMQSVAALQHSLSVTLYQHDAICCSIAALTLSHVVPARCNLLLHCSTHSQSRCTSTMQSVAALQHSLSVTLYQHDAICCSIAALTLSHVVPARCNLL